MDRKVPPQDIEAEMAVLGSVFVENACIRKISKILDATDFYKEAHRVIFRAMLGLNLKGNPIDLVSLEGVMKNAGELNQVGGAAYLAQLIDFVPTAENVQHYCQMVKEKSTARNIIDFGRKIVELGYKGDSLKDGLQEAKLELTEISNSMESFNGVHIRDIMTVDQRAERYIKYIRSIDNKRFITGFAPLDSLIRGVAPGEVMQIVAYSGTFKTAFLQNLLLQGCKRTGFYHLFFSLEMPVEKVFEREVQIQAGVSGYEVERKYKALKGKELQDQLYINMSEGLLVCDKPRLNLDKISRYIELTRYKFGNIGAVGIDYMGLMDAPGKSLFEKTAYISAESKNLAKEMNVPIIMLCQINRDSAKNQKEIETYSAKGGGDIEAGADFMLGFFIDENKDLICKLLKNRNERSGDYFKVIIDRDSLRFRGMEIYEKPKQESRTRKAV